MWEEKPTTHVEEWHSKRSVQQGEMWLAKCQPIEQPLVLTSTKLKLTQTHKTWVILNGLITMAHPN